MVSWTGMTVRRLRTEESFQRIFTTLEEEDALVIFLSMERCPIHGTNVTAGIMKRVSRKKIPGIQGKHIVKPMEMFLGMRCCLRSLLRYFI